MGPQTLPQRVDRGSDDIRWLTVTDGHSDAASTQNDVMIRLLPGGHLSSDSKNEMKMERVLNFLKLLHENNNREWFNAHKQEYLEIKGVFERFAMELVDGIREFDDSIGPLTIQDVTYRIYRDVRFSKDKSPYKCHIGTYICPGGKKSGFSGYYFHLSAADNGGWESGNIVAAGDYMCDPKVLKILREDIDLGGGDLRRIISEVDPRLKIDTSTSLKRVPQGFSPESEEASLLKLRNFCLAYTPDDSFVLDSQLKNNLLSLFKSAMPFVRYVNRAIQYVKEGNE